MTNRQAWTKKEILEMWPQAKKELQILKEHFERSAGLNLSQLDMALYLADIGFDTLIQDCRLFPRGKNCQGA